MSMIEIIISFAIRLSIAIMITILLTKLNYFKSASKKTLKSHGRRMIIWGVWIYFIFTCINLWCMVIKKRGTYEEI